MREVKRKAKIGEKIKIVDAFFPLGSYKNGDVLTVLRVLDGDENDEHRVCVEEFEQPFILTSEYVVLEGEKEMRFKVGDVVKIASCKHGHGFRIGERVRIVKATDTDYYAELIENGKGWWIEDDEIQPAPFTLSDLKPCMVVKTRDEMLGIVSAIVGNEMCVNLENGMFMGLLNHEEDLSYKSDSDFDIMEVYGFSEYAYKANKISTEDRELLFKREEPKPKRKMTIDEICKELGEDIEIVKGE